MRLQSYALGHPDRFVLGFLGLTLVINLLQAYFTDILFDEAYYWYFSQNLDWGYFDHPPMMALLIKISNIFFEGEIGVRLLAPFLYAGTAFFTWKLIEHPKKHLHALTFCMIVFALPLLTAYGFFLLPDTPLIFFSALFLWSYKRFLKHQSLTYALFMAVCMAAIMYSKYHGILLILAVIASHLKLLRNGYFWLAGIVALALYIPHLLWLWDTDFVTLEYHITQRAKTNFKFGRVFEYLGGQIAVLGFIFFFFFAPLFKTRKESIFLRTCLFVVLIYLGFFFLSSFNRNTQAQWTIVAIIPMMVLAFRYIIENDVRQLWFQRLAYVNIAVILFMRIALVFEGLLPINYEAHGNKAWVEELKEKTQGIPIIFENSYRDASMYTFYSGIPAFSFNNLYYRKSQYDIDGSEKQFQHKRVAFASPFLKKDIDFTYHTAYKQRTFKARFIENYRSARNMECVLDKEILTLEKDQEMKATLYNPYDEDFELSDLNLVGVYVKKNNKIVNRFKIEPQPLETLKAKDSLQVRFKLSALPKNEEAEFFRLAMGEFGLNIGFQGTPIPIAD